MAFAIKADNAGMLNRVLEDLGYTQSLGFSSVAGPIVPLVDACNKETEIVIMIKFDDEYFVIDAVDYRDGFGGQTSFEALEEVELNLLEQGVGIYRQW